MAVMHNKITISDVAKASGVSNSAVSYALNGKKGVSESTRGKVLKVAEEMGWRPNSTAKSLSDASTYRIGLVLMYSAEVLTSEYFTIEIIAGLTTELEKHGYALLVRSATCQSEEIAVTQDWMETGAVDAMLIMNLELGDVRIPLCKQHSRMPVLMLADPSLTDGLPALYVSERNTAHLIVDHLHKLGHRYVARVAGAERLGHTFLRDSAFNKETNELGIQYICLHTDYTPEQGRLATERLLSFSPRTTAIVYDNDVMALSGIVALQNAGLDVPSNISVVSWDDSFLCKVFTPSVTSVNQSVVQRGITAAKLLMDMIAGKKIETVGETQAELILRGSTAKPIP